MAEEEKKKGGRPRLTEEQKQHNKELREQAKKEQKEELKRLEMEKLKRAEDWEKLYLDTPLVKNAKGSEKAFNAALLRHSMRLGFMTAVNWYSAESIRARSKLYFETCIEDDVRPTVSGLCLAYGVCRETIKRILNREVRNDMPKECLEELQKAMNIINAQMESLMVSKKIDPVSGIFLMKNNFGYTDNQNYTFNVNQPTEIPPEKLIEEANALSLDDITEYTEIKVNTAESAEKEQNNELPDM